MQDNILEILKTDNINIIQSSNDCSKILNVLVDSKDIYKASELIKKDGFDMLISVTAVDYLTHFEVVYHFYSTNKKEKLIVKCHINRHSQETRSLCGLYDSADWHEREAFYLFEVHFLKHPNLKRILLPQDWIGHPLRKDYKMEDKRLSWNER